MIGFLPDQKVGGADRDRTCDPHNAIVLPLLDDHSLMSAFKNIDRFIDRFFPGLHSSGSLVHNPWGQIS